MDRPVIVGVDGSDCSVEAVRWAAAEAGRRGAPLRLVHTWVWPLLGVGLGPAPGAPPDAGLEAQAERILSEGADLARTVSPGLAVETSLVTGDASVRLVDASRDAQLLVVGHRGLGGFAGLLLGSVGAAVAAHAECPVAVVRGELDGTGPVVVGVDASERSQHVLQEAIAAADRLDAPVRAVHCVELPLRQHLARSYQDALAGATREARERLEKQVAEARSAAGPDVAVDLRLGDLPPAKELVAASADARLVVVGSRGAGGLTGMLLGSTGHALIHHSTCPVLIVR